MAHSRRFRIAGVLISILSLGGVAIWALSQPAPKLPDDTAGWLSFAGALGAYAVATGLRSERWLALLHRDGIEARRADAWGLTVVGFMGNNIIPARGGDALSAYLMSNRTQTLFRYTVASLIAMRLLDVVVLVLIYFIVAHGLLSGVDVPGGSLLGLELGILGLLALVGAGFWVAVRRGHFEAAGKLASELLGTTRRLSGAHGLAMFAVTVLIWVAEAATLLLCAEAVGFEITALESLYMIGLAGIFVLIPSGPGYAGTLDAALLFGARAIGASSSLALSFLLITRFVVFVPITLLGLVLMLTTYGWDSFGLRGTGEPDPEPASAGAAQ
jgi:uncharacterized membrane protein YbhN (UPF0104 family)